MDPVERVGVFIREGKKGRNGERVQVRLVVREMKEMASERLSCRRSEPSPSLSSRLMNRAGLVFMGMNI